MISLSGLKNFSLNSQFAKSLSKVNFFNFRMNNFSDSFKSKEGMEEKVFIDKKERELIKKLLEKLSTDEKDVKSKKESVSKEDSDVLHKILKKHKVNIPQELFIDIVLWKKGEF